MIHRGRRSLITDIRRLVRSTAFFDLHKKELLSTMDATWPVSGKQMYHEGEVLYVALSRSGPRGSLQHP